jgi:formimidoylglutamate deiminase
MITPLREPGLQKIWAPWAWLSGNSFDPPTWQANVLLGVDRDGHWSTIVSGVSQAPGDAQIAPGPLLPSFVNAHSHAFQRAFAGQTEHRSAESDDFWSWRRSMYGAANRITPEQLQIVASQLYLELLQGGYTQVCEFHYLQNRADGTPFDDPLTMTWALNRAAQTVGMGLTVLPVLYERAGLNEPALRPDQQRFKQSTHDVWQASQTINERQQPLLNAGLAIHSIRAASGASIRALLDLAVDFKGPIHIHVSEQVAEVEAAKIHYGARPIQWLAQAGFLDKRWQLVHATHTTQEEIQAAAACGASLVICPTTEGNLGDGLSDLPAWLSARVGMTIGSDSHASRDALEELRWLEYGQRLQLQKRNIGADPGAAAGSSGQRLFGLVTSSGARAAGLAHWGLKVGARADALVLNLGQQSLLGVPQPHWLDALIFSSPSQPWCDVMVAGQWVIKNGHHPQAASVARQFEETMKQLNP